uniref:3-ketodihydrosphingosine reductase-like n=1 Tax=Halichoerus grypus TaxID=9711 RepID=UPI001658DC7D|nr:3-ketodihydrosphingosine reductase-like [Halichoerus grypus]
MTEAADGCGADSLGERPNTELVLGQMLVALEGYKWVLTGRDTLWTGFYMPRGYIYCPSGGMWYNIGLSSSGTGPQPPGPPVPASGKRRPAAVAPSAGSASSPPAAAPPRAGREPKQRLLLRAAARDRRAAEPRAPARPPGSARPLPSDAAAGGRLVAFVLLYMVSPLISPKPLALPGAHVVVTGGSSGIGKCIAIECYKQGAFITLVARNEDKLLQAKKEIEKHSINDKQVVLCISVDVSQDYSQVENVIKQAQEKLGPVDMLVNCAGMSLSGKFEDLEVSTFERLMSVNYLGSVYPSRAVITTMKERRVGRIVFVSSQAGQLGLFGFTAYSSSKFAIRGLAEALQMEVKPYNVYVTVAYPPDTDTPGFAEENKTKPLETRLISETVSVCKPEQVAKQIVKDAIVSTILIFFLNSFSTRFLKRNTIFVPGLISKHKLLCLFGQIHI